MSRHDSPSTATNETPGRSTATGTDRPKAVNRREFLRLTHGLGGAAAVTAVAGCTGGGGTPTATETPAGTPTTTGTPEPVSMHHVVPEGSFYVVPFLYGVENDAWSQYGIDLQVEVGPFPKFQRQIVADLADVGGMPMVSAIDFRNKGEDLTWLGPGMTFANFMLAPADSDIETPEDIEGKRLGVPFQTSTTTLGYRALMQDAFGMSLLDAPSSVRAAAPPVIWNLMNQGELDVIIEFSGFSIRGKVSKDVRVVFNPIEYWQREYGSVVPLTQRTARMSWLQESPANADLAIRWGKGWAASLEIFRNNINDAINRYGRLGGLTSEAMAQVVVQRMEQEVQFSTPPYTQEQADSNWQFAKALQSAGVFETLPDRESMITLGSELEELASG
ncbi:MAG: ABC transporter substrate-binding protein [Halobacteriales archaeon]